MDFRIADTFTASLGKLNAEEQKLVKTTVFDLQLNPASPGHQLHKLDRAKDPDFWSARVSSDIRLIIHRTRTSFLLCYVDHHDDAYAWAMKRRIETHPTTGAAQIVQLVEKYKEVEIPVFVEKQEVVTTTPKKEPGPLLFPKVSVEELLSYGVPKDWIELVKGATQDDLHDLSECLPAEAAEAILELARGGKPKVSLSHSPAADPFEHPDAQRRFRTLANLDELTAALDYPWDQWAIFLHPSQLDYVDRDFAGPARIAGSAGTGKTVVAVHRAVKLAQKSPDAQVLLTTFSPALASQLKTKVKRLVASSPRLMEQIEIIDLDQLAKRLYQASFGRVAIASQTVINEAIQKASESTPEHSFTPRFLLSEWNEVVDAWQLSTWEEYRDVRRLGRKTRLPEKQRLMLWQIFEKVVRELSESNLITKASIYTKLAQLQATRSFPLYDNCVVDEAQDISVPQLRFLSAIGDGRPNALFFAGDQGQRIFQSPFSWLSLGVDVRGRSKCLTVNYRTSHQIRLQADRLLGKSVSDVDGIVEDRRGTISVFNGPAPTVIRASSQEAEIQEGSKFITQILAKAVRPHELCVIVRSELEFPRAIAAIREAGEAEQILGEDADAVSGRISISTMHIAKGHEYKAVLIMACDDEIIPLQSRIENVVDEGDLEEVYATERQLLYVAATRARDYLCITCGPNSSVFLDDLEGK